MGGVVSGSVVGRKVVIEDETYADTDNTKRDDRDLMPNDAPIVAASLFPIFF